MKKHLFVASLFLLIASLACSLNPSTLFATPTPPPTYTPQPTYTPLPTYTPIPTATAIPTATLEPTPIMVPGLDSFVKIKDVSFKFTDAYLSTDKVTIGNKTLDPNTGYSVLVLKATFDGDLMSLFQSYMQTADALYIDDGTSDHANWVQANFDGPSLTIGFFVKSNASQYILKNTVGTPWSIDLNRFLK